MTDIEAEINRLSEAFGVDRKRSIGEAAEEIGVETHVIRFWEEHFPQIKPELGKGGRRSYYNKQIKMLRQVKKSLYEDGLTIAGLQKMLKKRKKTDINGQELDILVENDAISQNIDFSNKELLNRPISDFIDSTIDFSANAANINEAPRIIHNSHHDIDDEEIIDESAKEEVLELVSNISQNLRELKNLLKN